MNGQEITVFEIVQALGTLVIRVKGDTSVRVSEGTEDSRKVLPGGVFCAICGSVSDGHKFIPQALEKGAKVVVLEKAVTGLPKGIVSIEVSNGYRAAGIISDLLYGNRSGNMRLIGVTGTNGKTTTAFLLRAIFTAAHRKPAMLGTVEYDLAGGTPKIATRTTPTAFALQEMLNQADANGASECVMEVSSHALSLQRLGRMRVDAALFTNLTLDHMDYHKNIENYYQAKKLLFTRHLNQYGIAIINMDDACGYRLDWELTQDHPRLRVIGISLQNANCAVRVTEVELGAHGSKFKLSSPWGTLNLETPLVGEYNVYNVAGAVALALAYGIDAEAITEAVRHCTGAPGRLQRIGKGDSVGVFVDYAHTPDAMMKVIPALRAVTRGKLYVVFGCGGDRDRTKRPIMGKVVSELADEFVITSDNPRTEDPAAIIADIVSGIPDMVHGRIEVDRKKALESVLSQIADGDVVLVAGKGHEDYQEINGVKYPYSDIETCEALLNRN